VLQVLLRWRRRRGHGVPGTGVGPGVHDASGNGFGIGVHRHSILWDGFCFAET
jgi:hypothetical protein